MRIPFYLLPILFIIALLGVGYATFQSNKNVPQDFSLYYSNNGCYGTCPVYSIRITADGSGIYQGKAHVKTTGTETFSISQRNVRKLKREIDRVTFFSLPDTVFSGVSDLGNRTIEVTDSGKTKKITFDLGGEDLDRLADVLQDTVRINKFIK
jgi:hypothetical protein